MGTISSNIIYLITNIFRTYVLFRFLGIFFKRKLRINKKIELIVYIVYFIINSTLHLAFSNPLINLISNLVLFYFLTLIYEGKILTRITSIVIMYSSSMIIESIVYSIIINFGSLIDIENFGTVVSNILLFIFTFTLESFFGRNKSYDIKLNHLFIIFCIPVGSILIITTVFLEKHSPNFNITVVSVLLAMNILNFYLYDIIIKHYNDKHEKNLLKQQSDAYSSQLKIMMESQASIKKLKHDMKNHMVSIQDMIRSDKKDEFDNYLQTMFNYIRIKNEYVGSGNSEIDSLLNYKLFEAEKLNTEIYLEINIPSDLNIESFDLAIVLGNLLDNALDALEKVSERYLYIEMRLEKSMLFITVKNTYNGIINKSNGTMLSIKKDIENHGYGLKNIENVVEKYNGNFNISYNDNMFSVNILLYVN